MVTVSVLWPFEGIFYFISVVLKYCLCLVTYMNVYVINSQNKDCRQLFRMEQFYSRSSFRFKKHGQNVLL